ncbi:NAD-dependent epimerase/dehydratase family protein [Streptomyces sp. A7024]|uniref:NAD-dependent epimerase/dehydratase family protein n=1 Tax=Streptomyces coryli TaxID=1128680 RepID=A0A6G4UC93_9ACTN|nr:NAD-dependent epimerase/dehydratase family protein [Streptomyces coryli]NGN69296.1 NAD-dependent epimerase/dehydratase family protein [Streptomyces coryli]
MRRQRALVTGGAGFLGSHLCERLLADGAEVICADNLSTGTLRNIAHLRSDPAFHFVHADVAEPGALDRLPTGDGLDLVLHFACPAAPADYLRLPLETLAAGSDGTRHALELAARHGARFVLASTSEVYGDPETSPQPESYHGNVDPVGPRSVYDEAKRFAETLTTAHHRARGTDTAIVRLFNTYGPRMRPGDGRAVPAFIRQALDGAPVTVAGDGSQTRSLCYVDDTIDGILALAASDLRGPVNIGGCDETSVLEIAKRVVGTAGSHSAIKFGPRPADDPEVRCPDTALARERLGWHPRVGEQEGLRRTIAWFAEAAA